MPWGTEQNEVRKARIEFLTWPPFLTLRDWEVTGASVWGAGASLT